MPRKVFCSISKQNTSTNGEYSYYDPLKECRRSKRLPSACLEAALGPLACIATALGPLACLAAALGPLARLT